MAPVSGCLPRAALLLSQPNNFLSRISKSIYSSLGTYSHLFFLSLQLFVSSFHHTVSSSVSTVNCGIRTLLPLEVDMLKQTEQKMVPTSEPAAGIHCERTRTHTHTEETHSLDCGFPDTPAMACWPICIGPMAPMPPTGAPAGRGPMPMAPGPPPTPVRLVRAFMGSSRR